MPRGSDDNSAVDDTTVATRTTAKKEVVDAATVKKSTDDAVAVKMVADAVVAVKKAGDDAAAVKKVIVGFLAQGADSNREGKGGGQAVAP
jgi:hypothetical protein